MALVTRPPVDRRRRNSAYRPSTNGVISTLREMIRRCEGTDFTYTPPNPYNLVEFSQDSIPLRRGLAKRVRRVSIVGHRYRVGWVVDADFQHCMRCFKEFGWYRGRPKHHCRTCGALVCHDCSPFNVEIPVLDEEKGSRVCRDCFGIKPGLLSPLLSPATTVGNGGSNSVTRMHPESSMYYVERDRESGREIDRERDRVLPVSLFSPPYYNKQYNNNNNNNSSSTGNASSNANGYYNNGNVNGSSFSQHNNNGNAHNNNRHNSGYNSNNNNNNQYIAGGDKRYQDRNNASSTPYTPAPQQSQFAHTQNTTHTQRSTQPITHTGTGIVDNNVYGSLNGKVRRRTQITPRREAEDRLIRQYKEEMERYEREQAPRYEEAYKKMREIIPLDIHKSSMKGLIAQGIPEEAAKRLWNTKILWLIVMHTSDIAKIHLADFRSKYHYDGLDVVEMRALWHTLRKCVWETDSPNPLERGKSEWRDGFKSKLDDLVYRETRGTLPQHLLRHSEYEMADELRLFDPEDHIFERFHRSASFRHEALESPMNLYGGVKSGDGSSSIDDRENVDEETSTHRSHTRANTRTNTRTSSRAQREEEEDPYSLSPLLRGSPLPSQNVQRTFASRQDEYMRNFSTPDSVYAHSERENKFRTLCDEINNGENESLCDTLSLSDHSQTHSRSHKAGHTSSSSAKEKERELCESDLFDDVSSLGIDNDLSTENVSFSLPQTQQQQNDAHTPFPSPAQQAPTTNAKVRFAHTEPDARVDKHTPRTTASSNSSQSSSQRAHTNAETSDNHHTPPTHTDTHIEDITPRQAYLMRQQTRSNAQNGVTRDAPLNAQTTQPAHATLSSLNSRAPSNPFFANYVNHVLPSDSTHTTTQPSLSHTQSHTLSHSHTQSHSQKEREVSSRHSSFSTLSLSSTLSRSNSASSQRHMNARTHTSTHTYTHTPSPQRLASQQTHTQAQSLNTLSPLSARLEKERTTSFSHTPHNSNTQTHTHSQRAVRVRPVVFPTFTPRGQATHTSSHTPHTSSQQMHVHTTTPHHAESVLSPFSVESLQSASGAFFPSSSHNNAHTQPQSTLTSSHSHTYSQHSTHTARSGHMSHNVLSPETDAQSESGRCRLPMSHIDDGEDGLGDESDSLCEEDVSVLTPLTVESLSPKYTTTHSNSHSHSQSHSHKQRATEIESISSLPHTPHTTSHMSHTTERTHTTVEENEEEPSQPVADHSHLFRKRQSLGNGNKTLKPAHTVVEREQLCAMMLNGDLPATERILNGASVSSVLSAETVSEVFWECARRGVAPVRSEHEGERVGVSANEIEREGLRAVLLFLIDNGAMNVNATHALSGETLLHLAVRARCETMGRALVRAHADLLLLDARGECALSLALFSQQSSSQSTSGSEEDGDNDWLLDEFESAGEEMRLLAFASSERKKRYLSYFVLAGQSVKARELVQSGHVRVSAQEATELLNACRGNFESMTDPVDTFELLSSLGAEL